MTGQIFLQTSDAAVQRARLKPQPRARLNNLHGHEFQSSRDRKHSALWVAAQVHRVASAFVVLYSKGFGEQLGLSIKD